MFIFQLIECTAAKYICSKAVFRPVLEDQCSVHFVSVGLTCNYILEETMFLNFQAYSCIK